MVIIMDEKWGQSQDPRNKSPHILPIRQGLDQKRKEHFFQKIQVEFSKCTMKYHDFRIYSI